MITPARPALTVQQVAKMLNAEVHSIYRYVKLGMIPYFRLGATIRFDPDKFEKWYSDQQIG